jgi:hypothetical protein
MTAPKRLTPPNEISDRAKGGSAHRPPPPPIPAAARKREERYQDLAIPQADGEP